MAGVFPLATSLDSLGPLSRTVQDAIWIDAAMRGRTAPDIIRTVPTGLSLVVPTTVVMDDAEEGVIRAFEAALAWLSAAGVKVRRAAFPAFDALFQVMAEHGPLVTAEAFALHHCRLAGPEAESMDRRVVARTRLGEKITLVGYLEILKVREQLIKDAASTLGPNELIAYPSVAHVAPALGPLEADDELFVKVNFKTLRNTLIGNFLDWCGVSLPCGKGSAGMPVGFLLSAPKDQDERLLTAALALEDTVAG
ncbi:Amidase [Rhizobium miluonense]|uniref:Amidase n=1 Tax=Rhizobium miluonense TaxID=411945 RepID=A0A1C3X4M5_9HYPH|nr:Amidase [Rhizobium miluonense]